MALVYAASILPVWNLDEMLRVSDLAVFFVNVHGTSS